MFNTLSQITQDRRWNGQLYPAPIVLAIIRNHQLDTEETDDSFLLIQRNKAPYKNMWALVGGKWDFGESLPEAVVREVKEETGLLTRYISLQGILNERLMPANGSSGNAAHFLILVCLLEMVSGDAQEQDEGVVSWFTHSQIEDLNQHGKIIPSDYLMLTKFYHAKSLPFYEVEMITDRPVKDGRDQSNLVRFELIVNDATSSS